MPESSSFRSRVRRFTLVVVLADGGPAPRHSEPSRSIRRAREICQLACSGTVAALGEMNRAGMF
jgi:hypothetical protein